MSNYKSTYGHGDYGSCRIYNSFYEEKTVSFTDCMH